MTPIFFDMEECGAALWRVRCATTHIFEAAGDGIRALSGNGLDRGPDRARFKFSLTREFAPSQRER